MAPEDVHVWLTERSCTQIGALAEILSPDERQKAQRFHFQVDRERYIVGRALVRLLLGHLLDISADRVNFSYNDFGKPYLSQGEDGHGLRFNVSHSGELVLVAVAAGREIGVDVELIREDLQVDDVATRFFSARERQDLASLPPNQRHAAFFSCWSRKEAFIKAKGVGLSLSLALFDVSLRPGEAAMLLETRSDPVEASRWVIRDIDVGPSYKAALAVEGSGWELKTMGWRPQSHMRIAP